VSRSAPEEGAHAMRRRPMARATRVALFRREIREWISPPALEILLGAADIVAEGSFEGTAGAEQLYLASIQATVDLPRCAAYIREPLDAAAARQLARHIHTDETARGLLMDLARREAERTAGCPLYELQVEIEASHRGESLLVALDVEARTQPVAPRVRMEPAQIRHRERAT